MHVSAYCKLIHRKGEETGNFDDSDSVGGREPIPDANLEEVKKL